MLDPATGEALARAVVFRNILVHRYRQIDDRIVVGNLQRLADFDAFVAAFARWIDDA